jgi:RNA polymerase sigma factor (sigma-70 family)
VNAQEGDDSTRRDDTEPDVATLVRQAASGNRASWDALVDRFGSMIWSIARGMRLSAADAADVSQTTWLRLFEHLDRIEHPERIGGWLATTARRECLRVQKHGGRQVLMGDDVDLPSEDTADSTIDLSLLTDERDAALWEAFSEMPPRARTLLSLLMTDPPISYKEISETMDMPIGSIGPTRARMLNALRARVERNGIMAVSGL